MVLAASLGKKVGLVRDSNKCVTSEINKYFSLRKRIRGQDYSWGVGSEELPTMADCNRRLKSARLQAETTLNALAYGADPTVVGTFLNRETLSLAALPY